MGVLVFANGVIEDVDWIRPFLEKAEAVVTADGGSNHLAKLGVRPDVVVGDLDSMDSDLHDAWKSAGTIVVRYPAEKDETDLELALLYAVRHYAGDIQVMGALGGRLDQTLANILLLAHPAFAGRRVELVEPYQRAWLVRERTEIVGRPGDTVSLVPLGGDVQIGRTTNLKWKLQAETLRFGPARGISNVMLGERATVEVERGTLLCVHLEGGERSE
ncbi:MAG: thiamine diphosphokinase [Candidatus Promineifilaceae bacterium]